MYALPADTDHADRNPLARGNGATRPTGENPRDPGDRTGRQQTLNKRASRYSGSRSLFIHGYFSLEAIFF